MLLIHAFLPAVYLELFSMEFISRGKDGRADQLASAPSGFRCRSSLRMKRMQSSLNLILPAHLASASDCCARSEVQPHWGRCVLRSFRHGALSASPATFRARRWCVHRWWGSPSGCPRHPIGEWALDALPGVMRNAPAL